MRLIREGLRLQFVRELSELVEIDARPEPEGMRNGPGRRAPPVRRGVVQARTDRAVDGLLERDAELPGALFQEPRKVVIERERGSHV